MTETPDINWIEVGTACMNLAQTLHTYYQSLRNEGFTDETALMLILSAQNSMFTAMLTAPPPDPE
jgi:hypothetical protein